MNYCLRASLPNAKRSSVFCFIYCFAIAIAGQLSLSASDASAQTRTITGNRLDLTRDGGESTMSISYIGTGNYSLLIPAGDAAIVPVGSVPGQTLAWNGTQWTLASTMQITPSNVAITSGNLSVMDGTITSTNEGAGIGIFGSSLNANGVSGLSVNGTAASFTISNPENNNHAVVGSTNGGTGAGVAGVGPNGTGVLGSSVNATGMYGSSTNGRAAYFENTGQQNNAPVVTIATNGTGPALLLTNGGLVGTYQTVANGGTISTSAVTVFISGDGAAPTVNPPSAGINGQLMIVCTGNTNGATITGIGTLPANGCITLAYAGGAWHATK